MASLETVSLLPTALSVHTCMRACMHVCVCVLNVAFYVVAFSFVPFFLSFFLFFGRGERQEINAFQLQSFSKKKPLTSVLVVFK